MIFQTLLPKAPLSDFVEMFWLFEGYTIPHDKELLLPTGVGQLVINLHENETRIYNAMSVSTRALLLRLNGTPPCNDSPL